jgi:DNA-binding LacI/PurR family transcriptional regulator
MKIIRTSPFSGNTNSMEIEVTLEQLRSWQVDGVLIQNAMPHLTPDEREFIKTGITSEEWDSAFN